MIRDCFKRLNDPGLGKVISPDKTCILVLKKLQTALPIIYSHNVLLEGLTGIPQYKVLGTKYFQEIVGIIGQNGKGQTKEQALASGLMELVERYSCFKHLRDQCRVASWREINNNPFRVEDFCAQFLHERINIDYQKLYAAKIRWSEASTLEGKKAYLPMNLINFILQGTNGMAAGNSFEEALLHATCEVIERHCLTIIEHKKLKTPIIKPSTINSPRAIELIEKFRSIGLSLLIKDFSLGLGLPVIGVINRLNKNECNITAGVAAHREEALIRALTENSQSLALGGQNTRKLYHCKYYFENSDTLSFKEIPCVSNTNIRLEIESISRLLRKRKMEVFYINMTDRILNIPAVQVYIAGAKFYKKERIYKNSLIALFNESFCIGKLKEAKNYIRDGINLKDCNQGVYFYFMGLLLMQKSQYKKAIQYFLMSVNIRHFLKEIKKDALAQLGICFEAIKDINSAVNAYTKLLDLSRGLGLKSLEKRSRTLSFLPKNEFFVEKSLYGEIKFARSRFSKMKQKLFIEKFRTYLKKRKTLIHLLVKASKYFYNNQHQLCIRQVKKAILVHYFARRIYNLNLFLVRCFCELSQYKKAINELMKMKKMDPDNNEINFTLAYYYKCIGQNKRYKKELNNGFQKFRTLFRIGGLEKKGRS